MSHEMSLSEDDDDYWGMYDDVSTHYQEDIEEERRLQEETSHSLSAALHASPSPPPGGRGGGHSHSDIPSELKGERKSPDIPISTQDRGSAPQHVREELELTISKWESVDSQHFERVATSVSELLSIQQQETALLQNLVGANAKLSAEAKLRRNLTVEIYDKLKATESALKTSDEQCSALRDKANRKDKEIESLKEELERLRKGLSEASASLQQTNKENAELTSQLESSTSKIGELGKERDDLKEKTEVDAACIAKLNDEKQSLLGERDTLSKSLESSESCLVEKTKELAEGKAQWQKTEASFRKKAEEHVNEIERLRSDVESQKNTIAEREESLADMKKTLEDKEANFDQLKSEKEAGDADRLNLQKRLDDEVSKLASERAEKEKLESNVDTLTQKLSDKSKEASDFENLLQNNKEELEATTRDLDEERMRLEGALQDLEGEKQAREEEEVEKTRLETLVQNLENEKKLMNSSAKAQAIELEAIREEKSRIEKNYRLQKQGTESKLQNAMRRMSDMQKGDEEQLATVPNADSWRETSSIVPLLDCTLLPSTDDSDPRTLTVLVDSLSISFRADNEDDAGKLMACIQPVVDGVTKYREGILNQQHQKLFENTLQSGALRYNTHANVWSERFGVLSETELIIYESSEDGATAVQTISLRDATLEMLEWLTSKTYSFAVWADGKVHSFTVAAKKAEEVAFTSWVENLSACISYPNGNPSATPEDLFEDSASPANPDLFGEVRKEGLIRVMSKDGTWTKRWCKVFGGRIALHSGGEKDSLLSTVLPLEQVDALEVSSEQNVAVIVVKSEKDRWRLNIRVTEEATEEDERDWYKALCQEASIKLPGGGDRSPRGDESTADLQTFEILKKSRFRNCWKDYFACFRGDGLLVSRSQKFPAEGSRWFDLKQATVFHARLDDLPDTFVVKILGRSLLLRTKSPQQRDAFLASIWAVRMQIDTKASEESVTVVRKSGKDKRAVALSRDTLFFYKTSGAEYAESFHLEGSLIRPCGEASISVASNYSSLQLDFESPNSRNLMLKAMVPETVSGAQTEFSWNHESHEVQSVGTFALKDHLLICCTAPEWVIPLTSCSVKLSGDESTSEQIVVESLHMGKYTFTHQNPSTLHHWCDEMLNASDRSQHLKVEGIEKLRPRFLVKVGQGRWSDARWLVRNGSVLEMHCDPQGEEEIRCAPSHNSFLQFNYYEAEATDDVDVLVAETINEMYRRNQLLFTDVPLIRLSEGVYQFGTRKIHISIMHGKLVVRVGGGYANFEQFVNKYGQHEAQKIKRALEADADMNNLAFNLTDKGQKIQKHAVLKWVEALERIRATPDRPKVIEDLSTTSERGETIDLNPIHLSSSKSRDGQSRTSPLRNASALSTPTKKPTPRRRTQSSSKIPEPRI